MILELFLDFKIEIKSSVVVMILLFIDIERIEKYDKDD